MILLHLLAKIFLSKTLAHQLFGYPEVRWIFNYFPVFTSFHIMSWFCSVSNEFLFCCWWYHYKFASFNIFDVFQSISVIILFNVKWLWPLAPVFFWDELSSLLVFLIRCPRHLLYISCSRVGISHSSKKALILLEGNVTRDHDPGSRVLIVTGLIITSRWNIFVFDIKICHECFKFKFKIKEFYSWFFIWNIFLLQENFGSRRH